MSRRTAVATALAAALASLLAIGPVPATAKKPERRWTCWCSPRRRAFRHASIPAGIAAVREHGLRVRATEDASLLRRRTLRKVEVVLFLDTTGVILDRSERRALARHVRGGGGFVGVHAAADTEHDWSFYERLVGARFFAHPVVQTATVVAEDRRSPATAHLDRRFEVTDELYSFQRNPRSRVHVLLSVDESTYEQDPNTTYVPGDEVETSSAAMGDHPMSWCHDVGTGRAFYTAFGHEAALYGEPWFRRHLLGGIRLAARTVKADCSP